MSNRPEREFASLIPELKQWNNGAGISIESWIACVGDFEHAIGYGRMFWPEFVEYDGCVFHQGFSESAYESCKQCCSDGERPEGVMNHWHLAEHFSAYYDGTVPTEEQVVYLGRLLKEMWECKLKRDFPDKKFLVSFSEGSPDDLEGYEITFYQVGVPRQDTSDQGQ